MKAHTLWNRVPLLPETDGHASLPMMAMRAVYPAGIECDSGGGAGVTCQPSPMHVERLLSPSEKNVIYKNGMRLSRAGGSQSALGRDQEAARCAAVPSHGDA